MATKYVNKDKLKGLDVNMIERLGKAIDDLTDGVHPIKNIIFYKTKMVNYCPYETKILETYPVTIEKLSDITESILENELDVEYSICLNGATPEYDNKKSGYRLTYSIQNTLDSFQNKIFSVLSNLGEIFDGFTEPNITPTRSIFLIGLILFMINHTTDIQDSELKRIETIAIIRKEKKTNVIFQTSQCETIDELEQIIKRTFVFNSFSSFTKKSFNK